jgi:hypothetical protein
MKLPNRKCALQSSKAELWYLISIVVKKWQKLNFTH